MPTKPVITLLTDFGEIDSYVGVMKGAIAQINSDILVVDLTHQIPPQNLTAAQFNLTSAYSYFPPHTVHIVVVDPGVGSKRRAIAVQLDDGFLVGPDNGVFSALLAQHLIIAVVELNNSKYWRASQPSATFHGRDIFAPAGAYLASGISLNDLGSPLTLDDLVTLPPPHWQSTPSGATGQMQYIDHFGNIVTSIPGDVVHHHSWSLIIGSTLLPGKVTYSDVQPGEALALVGSHGWIEIAINNGNAQGRFQFSWSVPIQVIIQTAN
jgi:S-adenosylmethionine hydrolase